MSRREGVPENVAWACRYLDAIRAQGHRVEFSISKVSKSARRYEADMRRGATPRPWADHFQALLFAGNPHLSRTASWRSVMDAPVPTANRGTRRVKHQTGEREPQ